MAQIYMKERITNQIFVNKDNYQDEYKFDICQIIEELNKLPFDFYISGSLICKFFFKEHSRYIKDIDIVTKCDLKEVESIFRKHFNVVEFVSGPISDIFFVQTFLCVIKINDITIQIDGMKLDFLDEIEPQIYKINDTSFKGAPIEYVIATKIHGVLNKSKRPYKHLVDVYTASLLDKNLIDKNKIKNYLRIYYDHENKVRKMFKKPKNNLNFYMEKDKSFTGPIYLTTLQARHNISKEAMIEEVNKWLKTF